MKLLSLLSPDAQDDLSDIYRWTAKNFGLDSADAYTDEIGKAVKNISNHPHIGKDRAEMRKGYSSFPVRQHVLWYRQLEGRIEVIRILHGAMDPERQL
jgi:toxin ParE1/3/4